ncbi:ribonuclease P protein component [Chloroflexota bacterium]
MPLNQLIKGLMRGEEYLTKPRQYGLVYSKGSSRASNLVVMRALPSELQLSRYGFSVSKRVGNAVTRNRVKRWLREILRIMPLKSGWDIVFIARPAASVTDYASLKSSVEELLSQAHLLKTDEVHGLQTEVKLGVSSLTSGEM